VAFQEQAMPDDAYTKLIRLLDDRGVRYRLIDHAPEGRTDKVSVMRGHDASAAAKCIILMVKLGKKTTKHVLAVVPGDRRIGLGAVKNLFGATYVSFASTEIAERLAETVTGTILPFSFSGDLELVVDPSVGESGELFFNAARLDRSISLRTEDYLAVANPRVAKIVEQ
jgi:Ala-tRNA(Pro) deacylase